MCRLHAERLDRKLVPFDERHRLDREHLRGELWNLYADLKAGRGDPHPAEFAALTARFDALFAERASIETLNRPLAPACRKSRATPSH